MIWTRAFERIIVGFSDEIIHQNRSYSGVVENLSENCICMNSYASGFDIDAQEGEVPELKLHIL